MKRIVISGINLYSGGTLSIYRDCLLHLSTELSQEYEIIALVHKKELFLDIENIKYLEYPKSRKNWLNRLLYEYIFFKKISKKLNPYIWFSIHDMTPNVKAEKRIVYCHNAMPFYKMTLNEMIFDKKVTLFSWFYKYLYKINLKKNDYIIVQQDWIRKEFSKMYSIAEKKIIVAHPSISENAISLNKVVSKENNEQKTFIYPTFPRVFKNIEVICEACKILENKLIQNFIVYITIDGNENSYSKSIVNKYSDLKTVEFIGIQKRDYIYELYNKVDALIFPSKLETWGLPITEFKLTNKIIICANLPYAKETLGTYDKGIFFNTENAFQLAEILEKIINDKKIKYSKLHKTELKEPFSENWKELFEILINEM